METTDIRKKLEKKIGTSLPTLPTVVTKILEIALDPTTSAQDAAQVVETDQALSSKLLKIVNSPFYGLRHEVSTVRHAIALIGFQTLKSLVLSVSIFEDAFDKSGEGLDKSLYWQHSLATAAVARSIAKQVGYPTPEEAYVAGLLHDMGKIIIDQHMHEEMKQVTARAKEDAASILTIEQEITGCDHAQVGGWVADKWNLPPILHFAIENHHNNHIGEEFPESFRWMAYIINMADFIAWTQGIGSIDSHVLRLLNLRVEEGVGGKEKLDITKILEEMDTELTNTAKLFKFDVPDMKKFRSALQKANVQLGRVNSLYHDAKEELETRVTELSTLNDAICRTRQSLKMDDIITNLVETVYGGLNFDRAMYFEVDNNSQLVRIKRVIDSTNLETNLDNHVFPIRDDGSVIGKCIFDRAPYICENPDEAKKDVILSALDVVDVAISPIIANQQVIGILCGNNELTNEKINPDTLKTLSILTSEAGMAIENAMLYEEKKNLAITDALTQIPNRLRAREFIEFEINRARRYKRPLGIIMFDVDFFKKFNDTYGHDAGDVILKQVAQVLKYAARNVDLVARYGGEEFIAILPETPLNGSIIFAERVRRAIEKLGTKLKPSYPECTLTLSCGVSEFDINDMSEDQDTVIKRADQALYRAKQQGRNQVCVEKKADS